LERKREFVSILVKHYLTRYVAVIKLNLQLLDHSPVKCWFYPLTLSLLQTVE